QFEQPFAQYPATIPDRKVTNAAYAICRPAIFNIGVLKKGVVVTQIAKVTQHAPCLLQRGIHDGAYINPCHDLSFYRVNALYNPTCLVIATSTGRRSILLAP